MGQRKAKNILFLMFDQLRRDYLSCYGHPHLHTPNIDKLASQGVRFDRAYVQSPLCGPSRMSTYTGRYVSSHGTTWNNVPLKIGELTLGDHLRAVGMDCALVGKTHMKADLDGMARLGIEPEGAIGQRLAQCGFDVFERDDGLRAEGPDGFYDEGGALAYNRYLQDKGYEGDNPWHDFANSGLGESGEVLSGWFLENSDLPANIAEADSETPYMFRRGMDFIAAQGDQPWCCHLSLIKPHWPYIVPEPYASMFGRDSQVAPNRSAAEKTDAHPLLRKMQSIRVSQAFADVQTRAKVIQAYMGLVKQIDDQVGHLLNWLQDTGRMDDTMIVLTSDHGDFLGDHWLGEKMFFYDCSTRVPLIIYDPSSEADKTRGSVCDELVESIDLVPTFIDVADGDASELDHILDGHSLLPLLHGQASTTKRDFVISELDTAGGGLGAALGLAIDQARMWMIADKDWKLIHFETGDRPMLFDLKNDPDELDDLGDAPEHHAVVQKLTKKLHQWALRPSARTTISRSQIATNRQGGSLTGVLIGVRNADEAGEAGSKYIGRKATDHRDLGKS